jgi:hypothetical protein
MDVVHVVEMLDSASRGAMAAPSTSKFLEGNAAIPTPDAIAQPLTPATTPHAHFPAAMLEGGMELQGV